MFEAGIKMSKIVECLHHKLDSGSLSRKLTVIEPYFFSSGGFGLTKNTIISVLEPFRDRLEVLEVVTVKDNCNARNRAEIERVLDFLEIQVIYEEKFHDRFWIIDDERAFVVGASINGFGNKHFFIQDDFLSVNDTNDILRLYRPQAD